MARTTPFTHTELTTRIEVAMDLIENHAAGMDDYLEAINMFPLVFLGNMKKINKSLRDQMRVRETTVDDEIDFREIFATVSKEAISEGEATKATTLIKALEKFGQQIEAETRIYDPTKVDTDFGAFVNYVAFVESYRTTVMIVFMGILEAITQAASIHPNFSKSVDVTLMDYVMMSFVKFARLNAHY